MVQNIVDETSADWQRFIARVPKWDDLPDEQKTSMLSYMGRLFPDDVYVVVDSDNTTKPLAVCGTREEAIDLAEYIINEKWNGVRHVEGDVETASVSVYKRRVGCRIDEDEIPDTCWDALTASCQDCCVKC